MRPPGPARLLLVAALAGAACAAAPELAQAPPTAYQVLATAKVGSQPGKLTYGASSAL